ncbi:MAG: hypothetical protein ISR90_06185 [Candidatus Marinimicrobia bacterium]|nr:hypothetical protein [Candidatus Neomarinimicrobiota bacterium]MBL7023620.1 hypothetical protein [Candidatus Neomarinimicrobiota bacterium]MBL7109807.1 hypothetical protein [Candidatus Neomarinimicrobiota bacterium]
MSQIWENILKKFGRYSERIADKSGVYLKKAVDKGDELTKLGKIQFEIEKLKRELTSKNAKLGEYVVKQKDEKSSLDFSEDDQFEQLTEDSIKVRLHLKDMEKEKQKIKLHETKTEKQEDNSDD